MKLAIVGSYGHVGTAARSVRIAGVELVAAARYGPQDDLKLLQWDTVPKNLPIYDDWRKMLDETRPDVVGVFTPLHRLAQTSIEAVRRGCHVFSEKPLAITLEDLSALRAALAGSKAKLVACLSMRCDGRFQAIRAAVAAGRIGRPVLASAQKSYQFGKRDEFFKDRATYGGTIPWVAIHAIDLASWCAGLDYTRAAAMHSDAAHPSHGGCEDNGGILLEFAGGGHAVIRFDYLRPGGPGSPHAHGDDRLRIAGSEGIVETTPDGGVRLLTATAVEELPLPPARDLFAEFIASIQGRGPCILSQEESLRATEVSLLARHAADTGTVVTL